MGKRGHSIRRSLSGPKIPADSKQAAGDPFAREQHFWDTLKQIRAEKGVDLPKFYRELAIHYSKSIGEGVAKPEFDSLVASGCMPEILALAVGTIPAARKGARSWQLIFGQSPRERERKARILEKAAAQLESLYSPFNMNASFEWPAHMGSHSLALISSLRLHARVFRMFREIPAQTGEFSLEDVCKYCLTAYVFRATGRHHDREVSALVAAVLGTSYDETTQRMWRTRNDAGLEKYYKGFVALIWAMHVVISRENVTP